MPATCKNVCQGILQLRLMMNTVLSSNTVLFANLAETIVFFSPHIPASVADFLPVGDSAHHHPFQLLTFFFVMPS